MLTGAYLVVGNVYYAAIGLSVSVSLFVFWLTLRQTGVAADHSLRSRSPVQPETLLLTMKSARPLERVSHR